MTTAEERDTPCVASVTLISRAVLKSKEQAMETHLLAMHEHIHALPEPVVDPADGGLEMGLEVGGGAVEDVEAVALHLCAVDCTGAVDGGQPGCVEDLDEGADGVRGEEGGVEDGGEGAEVECAGAGGGGGGREDEVHGCAHCLHDFWWEVFKANHGWWWWWWFGGKERIAGDLYE